MKLKKERKCIQDAGTFPVCISRDVAYLIVLDDCLLVIKVSYCTHKSIFPPSQKLCHVSWLDSEWFQRCKELVIEFISGLSSNHFGSRLTTHRYGLFFLYFSSYSNACAKRSVLILEIREWEISLPFAGSGKVTQGYIITSTAKIPFGPF